MCMLGHMDNTEENCYTITVLTGWHQFHFNVSNIQFDKHILSVSAWSILSCQMTWFHCTASVWKVSHVTTGDQSLISGHLCLKTLPSEVVSLIFSSCCDFVTINITWTECYCMIIRLSHWLWLQSLRPPKILSWDCFFLSVSVAEWPWQIKA